MLLELAEHRFPELYSRLREPVLPRPAQQPDCTASQESATATAAMTPRSRKRQDRKNAQRTEKRRKEMVTRAHDTVRRSNEAPGRGMGRGRGRGSRGRARGVTR